MSETNETYLFACKGTRLDRNGQTFVILAQVDNASSREEGEDRVYALNKNTKRFRAGCVYEVAGVDGGKSIIPATAKFVGEFADEDKANTWQAETAAAELELRQQQRAKRFGDFYRIRRSIEPLRVAYAGLSAPDRLPFELWLLNELRKK